MPSREQELQKQFFEFLFGEQKGFLCISYGVPPENDPWQDTFFRWPQQLNDVLNYIQEVQRTKNVYFCVHLLDKAKRTKEHALPTRLVWADLDTQKPDTIKIKPSVVLETSPGRYHGFWRMSRAVSPELAEDYSRRIAYLLQKVDKGGWDLTQVLRIPFTINHKYDEKPIVDLLSVEDDFTLDEEFEKLPFIITDSSLNGDLPDVPELGEPKDIIERYIIPLSRTDFNELYGYEAGPSDDWSAMLWKLINTSLECGLSPEETFTVCYFSGVNKYERDGRPPIHLWRDINKAYYSQITFQRIYEQARALAMPTLYKESEVNRLPHYWLDDYIKWACDATDALPQYHGLMGMMGLSAMISSSVRLHTKAQIIVPNLWGMILGESTLTRKTTAMNLILNMLFEIDEDILIASDGTVEGILTALGLREKKAALFHRDEVSGFFNSINNKSYLAGMFEVFTQLYDAPPAYKRMLRKEAVHLSSPIFLFLAGGIKDRVYAALDEEQVLSGFLPRFLIVGGETDLSLIRPTTLATPVDQTERNKLRRRLAELYEVYTKETTIKVGDHTTEMAGGTVSATVAPKALERYQEMERSMLTMAHESAIPDLALPVFERLSRSLLKLAMILAASRKQPKENSFEIDKSDILKAATLISDWGKYSIDIALNCGVSANERMVKRIKDYIDHHPGISRSELMRRFHLMSKEANDVLTTLEDRGNIRTVKKGKATLLWVI